jgi:hypothetical protein
VTREEFDRRWCGVRTSHADDCLRKFSFDYEICTCGLDDLWKRRNDDLASVAPELVPRKVS